MKKIFMHAFANIRKTKSNTVSLFIMFLISGLLLNAGLLVFLNFGSSFADLTKELNTADAYYAMPADSYTADVQDYIKKNDNITKTQVENPLWCASDVKYKNKPRETVLLFKDMDVEADLSKWKTVGQTLPLEKDSIYIPSIYKMDGGYKLNDKFEFTLDGKTYSFTVKGFTEDVYFSSDSTALIGIYLPHEAFEKLKSEMGGQYQAAMIQMNLEKADSEIKIDLMKITKLTTAYMPSEIQTSFFAMDLEMTNTSRTMMANMMALMTVVFSLIIIIVCLIVVRFRVKNTIEDDIIRIGSLKAAGYTSGQIILSITAQFLLIAFAGAVTGIALSYLVTPAISNLFAAQSGLLWTQGFDIAITSISILFILFIVGIVTLASGGKIRNLSPIVALRGGISTHNFKRNFIPLDTWGGRLPLVLALKSFMHNMRQNAMIMIILISVAFSGVFAFVMFYNAEIDTRTFAEVPGIEISNAAVTLKKDTDNTRLIQDIKNMDNVRKAQFLDQTIAKIDHKTVSLTVMNDFALKETMLVYEGRYPLHDNEIALAGYAAEMIGKKIGDTVTLTGDSESEYLITGLTQGSNMDGMVASIRYDGMIKVLPDFKLSTLQIYLEKGTDAAGFIERLDKRFGDSILYTADVDKLFEEGMSAYQGITSKLGIGMLIVTFLVVIFVIYFVVSSSIIRRKRELGIQKALGYTTFQLMNQISIGFLPPVILGVIAGSILGIYETNPLMSLTAKAYGSMKANYIITPNWVVVISIGIVLISYLTSMLITWRIRKISAYALVTE